MRDTASRDNYAALHPALADIAPETRAAILKTAHRRSMTAGSRVFSPGDQCDGLPLMIRGEVRVQMAGASGNEIVLYRITDGDLCPLSLACLIAKGSYQTEAIVEVDSEVLLIPAGLADRLMAESDGFRRAVLANYGERLQALMMVIEEVAFQRLDQRLAERLIERQVNGQLSVTHQALAIELGTAREVISRLLKEFERRGLVELERGLITLIDREKLYNVGYPTTPPTMRAM